MEPTAVHIVEPTARRRRDGRTLGLFASVMLGLVFGWMGLIGLADLVVGWSAAFEAGWIGPWRRETEALGAAVFGWSGASAPGAVIDYLVVGGVTALAHLAGARRAWASAAASPQELGVAALIITLLWPLVWPMFFLGYAAPDSGPDHPERLTFEERAGYLRSSLFVAASLGAFAVLTLSGLG